MTALAPVPGLRPAFVPSLAECLVRVERVSVRRRGPREWRTGDRVDRAARLLHQMLLAAATEGISHHDIDAETDLPGACYDIVVGKALLREARR